MPARLFFSTHKVKKMLFRITKASLFSLLIVINVFTLVQPVFAQTGYTQIANVPGANKPLSAEITNNGYQDLFDKTSTLKLNTDWNTNPTKASELTFTLDAKFSINNNRPPAWFWNKIADAKDDRRLFVLRFCTVGSNGALDESSCGFAEWPYARTVVNDASLANAFTQDELDFIENANSSSWIVPNVASTISLVDSINTKLNNLRTKKIYHYHTEILLGDPQQIPGMRSATTNSDKEIDTFSTSYIPGSFYKAEDTLSTPIEKTLVKGGQYQADLWYCAAEEGGLGSLAGDKTKLEQLITGTPGTDQLRIFGTLCDKNHLAYIRLAGFRFTVPATAEDIAALNTENQEADASSNTQERSGTDSVLPTCAWFGLGSGSFVGCIAKLVYYLIFQPVNWITGLFGSLFDFFLGYSISDEAYRMGFAVEGWKLIRDISNIFFIIILVWTGFAAVFDIGNISMKKVVPTLIINALIINFSLFATRLVIDISNVVTRVFYNNMQVRDKEGNNIETAGYKSISTLIVSSFNPQNIFQTDKIQRGVNGADEYCSDNDTACLEAAKNQGGSFSSSRNANDQSFRAASTGGRGSTEYAGFFIIVTLLATMILLAVAKMFWKVSFFFLGRTIGLYTTMIFAPFAFLTRGGVPLVGNISQLKWSSWVEDLTKYALLGPIFILFLYVIVLFAGSDFALNISGRTFFETVLGIAIPMLIVYFLMKQAVGIAEEYSGKIGTMVQSTVEKGAGFVGGAALGIASAGTAVAGRNILGRLGQRIGQSERLRDASARGGIRGRLADRFMGLGQSMSRTSYDARNLSITQRAQAELGFSGSNNRLLGALNANQQQTNGGYQAAVQREIQQITRRADRFQINGLQATQQDARNRAWEGNYQTARNTAQQNAVSQGQVFDEVNFRTQYEQNQTNLGNTRPLTAAEINRQREQNHNMSLQRGTLLARIARGVTNRYTTPTGAVGATQVATGATIAGAAITAAAAVVGEGAIQNEAQQTVANQRTGQARNPVSAAQRQNMGDELNRLNGELTRVTQILNTIGQTLVPPVPGNQLTQTDLITYRNNLNQQIVAIRQQITQDEEFIRLNQNNPAQAAAVQFRQQRIAQSRSQEAQIATNVRESNSILGEFNRINQRIDAIRNQLGV